jgi:hypothetical protein
MHTLVRTCSVTWHRKNSSSGQQSVPERVLHSSVGAVTFRAKERCLLNGFHDRLLDAGQHRLLNLLLNLSSTCSAMGGAMGSSRSTTILSSFVRVGPSLRLSVLLDGTATALTRALAVDKASLPFNPIKPGPRPITCSPLLSRSPEQVPPQAQSMTRARGWPETGLNPNFVTGTGFVDYRTSSNNMEPVLTRF